MFLDVTTRKAEMQMMAARIPKKICWATTSLLLLVGADFESRRLGDGGHPLAQAGLVVQQFGDVQLRVLVLGRPEQGVEGAHLDTDPAVHAQAVVDVEAVEELHGA